MARAFGRILSSIWDDRDFLNLDSEAQRLYTFLVSQPNLNHAGLLPLTVRRWAAKAKGLTAQQVCKSLADLDAARFLVVDEDTEEVLVRSFVRRDEVYKQPRVMGAAVSGALEISSRRLRRALIAEMGRLPLDELNDEPVKLRNGSDAPSIRAQVMSHIDKLMKAFSEPSGPPSGGGSPTPSPTPSEGPSDTPAEEVQEGDAEGDWGTHARAGDPYLLSLTPSPTPKDNLSSSPTASPRVDKPKRDRKPEPRRNDVDALCNRLVELMIENECKPPTISEAWRTEARLLLDKDGRDFTKAMALLEWSQNDIFWKTNILSLPTFRKQYEQLRLKANAEWEATQPATRDQRPSTTTRIVNKGADLIRKMAAEDGIDLGTLIPVDFNQQRRELTA